MNSGDLRDTNLVSEGRLGYCRMDISPNNLCKPLGQLRGPLLVTRSSNDLWSNCGAWHILEATVALSIWPEGRTRVSVYKLYKGWSSAISLRVTPRTWDLQSQSGVVLAEAYSLLYIPPALGTWGLWDQSDDALAKNLWWTLNKEQAWRHLGCGWWRVDLIGKWMACRVDGMKKWADMYLVLVRNA